MTSQFLFALKRKLGSEEWRSHSLRGELHLKEENGVSFLFLDNPMARNAFSISMMMQFSEIVQKLESEPPSIFVIQGVGGHFCAGGDLEDVKRFLLTPEMGRLMCEYMQDLTQRIRRLPTYCITVLEGAAIGGGAEVLMLGDMILAAENAKVGFLQARLGVTPGWGGGHRLRARVGDIRATQILRKAEVYSSSQAYTLGLIDKISENVQEDLGKEIALLQKQPKEVCTSLMTWLHQSDDTTNSECDVFAKTWGSPEHCAALGLPKKTSVDGRA